LTQPLSTQILALSLHDALPISTDFYIAAGLVGLVMGGIQSLSRSTYSKLLPETDDTTSYFSFYDVTEKIGIIIGMSIYGLITQRSEEHTSELQSRENLVCRLLL